MIETFAHTFGDCFEIHLDDDAARKRGFDRRVAHGLLGLALTDGLKYQAETVFDALASLGWKWDFTGPIYAGDIVRVEVEIVSKRRSKSTGNGIIELQCDMKNQRDEVVQKGQHILLVR